MSRCSRRVHGADIPEADSFVHVHGIALSAAGPISEALGDLSKLEVPSLSDNQLIGEVETKLKKQ